MGIYIKDMEIPKSNNNFERVERILISSSGLVEWVDDNNTLLAEYEAIELLPHGRLIDADALTTVTEMVDGKWKTYIEVFEVEDAPTIIESEEEDG